MPSKSLVAPILAEIGDRVKNRPLRQKHDRLDDDDKLLILHGTSRGWTVKKIALTLPASQTTVKSFRAKIFEDPASVFDLPVQRQLLKPINAVCAGRAEGLEPKLCVTCCPTSCRTR